MVSGYLIKHSRGFTKKKTDIELVKWTMVSKKISKFFSKNVIFQSADKHAYPHFEKWCFLSKKLRFSSLMSVFFSVNYQFNDHFASVFRFDSNYGEEALKNGMLLFSERNVTFFKLFSLANLFKLFSLANLFIAHIFHMCVSGPGTHLCGKCGP